MGRKNDRVRRANDKGRMVRGKKGASPVPQARAIPRVALEDLVLPDGQCRFQTKRPKARFATAEKAAKALSQAQANRARMGTGHVEKRYYACPDGGCGGYHLSSREEFDERILKQRQEIREQGR